MHLHSQATTSTATLVRTMQVMEEFRCWCEQQSQSVQPPINSSLLDVCVIYRPPPNTRNKLTTKQFIADFGLMLEEYVTSTGHVVLLGDFNFHLDNENDPQARQINDLLYSLNFVQHVKSPTHCAGHILECVITGTGETCLSQVQVGDMVSDHNLVLCTFAWPKVSKLTRRIMIRKWREIDVTAFTNDVEQKLSTIPASKKCSEYLHLINTALQSMLDSHALQSQREITIRPQQIWFNKDLKHLQTMK